MKSQPIKGEDGREFSLERELTYELFIEVLGSMPGLVTPALLVGSEGTGKRMLVHAIAHECGANLFHAIVTRAGGRSVAVREVRSDAGSVHHVEDAQVRHEVALLEQ